MGKTQITNYGGYKFAIRNSVKHLFTKETLGIDTSPYCLSVMLHIATHIIIIILTFQDNLF